MTNKSLVWQNFSLLFDAADSEKYLVIQYVKLVAEVYGVEMARASTFAARPTRS